jgi:hypothetical protein
VAVLYADLNPHIRYKERTGKLLTVIPVGSKPVSAAIRRV